MGRVLRRRAARRHPGRPPLRVPAALHRLGPHGRARSRDEPRRVAARSSAPASPSRTTTARTPTSSSGRTSSAARRSSACACRGARPTRSRSATCGTASRAASRPRSTRRPRPRPGGARRFPVWNPATSYRWVLAGGELGYAWVNGLGPRAARPRRRRRLRAHARAARAGLAPRVGRLRDLPRPVRTRAGSTSSGRSGRCRARGTSCRRAAGRRRRTSSSAATSAASSSASTTSSGSARTSLYLTPVFPAASTHRYDATSFDRVDPLLGGDEALASLTRAAHDRGLRVVGDLTTNHTGAAHEWFVAARRRPGRARARALLLRRRAAERLRVLARHPDACRSSTGRSDELRAPDGRRSSAAGSSRRTRSTAGGSTSRR